MIFLSFVLTLEGGVIFLPREYLTIPLPVTSGKIGDGRADATDSQWVEARHAAQQPSMHKMSPCNKESSNPNANMVHTAKLHLQQRADGCSRTGTSLTRARQEI